MEQQQQQQQQQQQCPIKSSPPGVSNSTSTATITDQNVSFPRLIEKSVIIHRDENGFGLRIKGQAPVFIEHVHENGAAWRAGVRALDLINKVNGIPVSHMDHKDVVLTFKTCSRFVALTLMSPEQPSSQQLQLQQQLLQSREQASTLENSSLGGGWHSRQPSTYSQKVYQFFNRPESAAHNNQRRMSSATNSSLVSASPSSTMPMMDRTNSCRSTTSVMQAAEMRNQTAAMVPVLSLAARREQRQLGYLSRQGSMEELDGRSGGDKRFAVCICCRRSMDGQQQQQRASIGTCAQCQLSSRPADEDQRQSQGQRNTAQTRQLHASLRDGRPTSGRTSPRGSVSQQQQDISHTGERLATSATIDQIAAKSELARLGNSSRGGAITSKMSQSMSVNSLPGIEIQGNNLKLAMANNSNNSKPPLANLAKRGDMQQQLQPHHHKPPSSSSSFTQTNKRPPTQVNTRIEIIREFIDTERTHTERLKCLNELFYRPLKQAGFMSVEQLRMVFSCHRTLYKIHRQIYRILMSANYDAYSEPLIGSALLEIFEGDLKRRLERAACTFCSAQATNIELLNKMTRRDTKAGEFLAQVTSQRMVGRLGVKDLLASCFQRLTKYPLLLENLLKATPHEMPDDSEGDDIADDYGGGGQRATITSTSRFGQQNRQGGHQQRHHHHHNHRHRHQLIQSISDERLGPDEDDVDEEDYGNCGATNNSVDGTEASLPPLDTDEDEQEEEELRLARLGAAEEARRNSRRIMAISLAEEREFIERALLQSRQILVRVNDSIKVAIARNRLKEIWKRTDKYPDVPLSSIDISKQQVIHEGLLTLRLSKRSFDVYVLLLNDYIIILTREGQDKYRLKFFTPEGKSASFQSSAVAAAAAAAAAANSSSSSSSSSTLGNLLGTTTSSTTGSSNGAAALGVGATNSTTINNLTAPHQTVYSPIFLIDEHLTTRDAATDENGFYLLCKRKDDSRIYEFASRSPAERLKWRDKIQTAIERQMSRTNRRPSCASTLTKSSSEISANEPPGNSRRGTDAGLNEEKGFVGNTTTSKCQQKQQQTDASMRTRAHGESRPPTPSSEPTKIVGTITYVIDDGIVLPSKMESSRVFVDQAIQVNILDGSTLRGQIVAPQATN